ncbi:hypothetical protein MSAN_01225700 [Mycena sanguinolenta]|uniref:Uncharacterized protein n=1 Tax=Mycena sanguinolenta TaxID=230812 RepID=A0A8H7D4Q9_9AGAR|nr:hypothetical protein MSAN_01225700 [Mycena sanguinolenta]
MRISMRVWLALTILIPGVRSVDFPSCLAEVRSGQWGQTGGTDSQGHPVANISNAIGVTYELCLVACGSGQAPFQWSIFSQQFAAWLLPYLALVSQLPFGARYRPDNVVSMLLAVGSPTLAAYSLALTALNGYWIAQRFSDVNYPNARNAVKILSSLQQSPVQVNAKDSLFASLVVLHKNDEFWEDLLERLDFVHTWSIPAVASILWVIIAYVFTVVDSFTGTVTFSALNASGQAVGSIFLWLLPIVVGWLQISPKCESERLNHALDKANAIAYVAALRGAPIRASDRSDARAIYIRNDRHAGEIHRDEQRTPPIYNYARFLPWTLAVEHVYCAFREASKRSSSRHPVNPRGRWRNGDENNRQGCQSQVTAYVSRGPTILPQSRWGPGVGYRFLLAAFAALGLTWGTVGAAIVIAFFTPTKGLACRSGSFLIYGVNSTIVWLFLVASSGLAHHCTLQTEETRFLGAFSIFLRRCAKILASLNASWIILVCLFQFSSFFDRCWCDSSVFYLGAKKAYNVIDITDEAAVRVPWFGGLALAA